jgi:hypothetical protein
VALLVITAVGFTVTVRLNAVPAHPSTEGVITYTTSIGSVVPLTSVSVIDAVDPLPVAGVIPVTSARVQANVAVELLLVAVYVFDTLLHQFAVDPLVITAVGFTVMVNV